MANVKCLIIVMSCPADDASDAKSEPVESAPETIPEASPPVVQEKKPAEKQPVKPKWLKL
ncbi:unnamed protein product [Prunus armeniaca]|uniref:Uncharacterized protein n=1 Tax=Prunus armeniaca TaxID=36596 RepID=A0A6J5UGT5_PRUAR|nr:unnamed protein product [Prunus armeniaca]CAB4304839.1 unnamed protein product [Prunus armeniaca]